MPTVKVQRSVGRPTVYERAVTGWAVDVGNWIINWMSSNKKVASGESINSLEVEVNKRSGNVYLTGSSGVAWAMFGRKSGKRPPVENIKDWIKNKSALKPLYNSEQSLNQLAWAISYNIGKKGTKPPKLREQNFNLVVNQIGLKYEKELGEDMAKDVNEAIRKAWANRGFKIK